ncbi:MAG: type II secretion system GspH family protein [Comamonadaceae bacterium]|nr:type II secretion system GspH family protein [Comamonadaceae bacterium]
MLLVLMLLTGVLAPSIMDFVRDAQWVKVKEDCEAIGISVARVMRDVPPCFRLVGTDACTVDNRVDLLWSDGSTAGAISPTSSASTNYTLAGGNANGPLNWDTTITAQDGSMEQHLVRNDLPVPYPVPNVLFPVTVPAGPQQRAPAGEAPTSRRPSAPTPGATPTWSTRRSCRPRPTPTRRAKGATARAGTATSSVSRPGRTNLHETYFGGCLGTTQFGTCREGDDFTFVIQGAPASGRSRRADRRGAGRGATGFTLIELTVVLAVIVTLALILTPSIANSINEARVARGPQRLPDHRERHVPVLPGHGLLPGLEGRPERGRGHARRPPAGAREPGQRALRGRGIAVDHGRGGQPGGPAGDQRLPATRCARRRRSSAGTGRSFLIAAPGRPVGQPLRS